MGRDKLEDAFRNHIGNGADLYLLGDLWQCSVASHLGFHPSGVQEFGTVTIVLDRSGLVKGSIRLFGAILNMTNW